MDTADQMPKETRDRIRRDIERVMGYYEETKSFSASNPKAALWMARKTAEAICRQLFVEHISPNPGDLTLDKYIELLSSNGLLEKNIIIPLQTIRNYGNFGAHDQGEESDKITNDYIKPCLHSLETVIIWYTNKYKPKSPKPGGTPEATAESKLFYVLTALEILVFFTLLASDVLDVLNVIFKGTSQNTGVFFLEGIWQYPLARILAFLSVIAVSFEMTNMIRKKKLRQENRMLRDVLGFGILNITVIVLLVVFAQILRLWDPYTILW